MNLNLMFFIAEKVYFVLVCIRILFIHCICDKCDFITRVAVFLAPFT